MRNKRTLIVIAILTIVISAELSILSNLVSDDLKDWYQDNQILALTMTAVLITLEIALAILKIYLDGQRESEENVTNNPVNELDVLRAIHQAYRANPKNRVNSEQVRQGLGLSREQMHDFILALEGQGFIQANFAGDRALMRITADGLAVLQG